MALTRILEAACCAGRGSGFRNRPGQLGGAWRAQRSCSFPVWKNFNFPIAGKANLAPTSGGPRGELTHGRTPFLPHAQDDLLFSSPHSGPKFPLFLQGLRAFCLSHTGKLPSEEEVGGRPPLLTDLPPTPPYLPPPHTHTHPRARAGPGVRATAKGRAGPGAFSSGHTHSSPGSRSYQPNVPMKLCTITNAA